MIEAFRENGLNTLEPQSEVSVARLETLVSSLYHNLNKRLPIAQQVPVDSRAGLLLNWLIAAYSNGIYNASGKIRVFSIKVALATMCAGKLVDKLRCESQFFNAFNQVHFQYNLSVVQTSSRRSPTAPVSWSTGNSASFCARSSRYRRPSTSRPRSTLRTASKMNFSRSTPK